MISFKETVPGGRTENLLKGEKMGASEGIGCSVARSLKN